MDSSVIEKLSLKYAFNDLAVFSNVKCIYDYFKEILEHSNKSRVLIYDSDVVGHSVILNDTYGVGRDKVFVVENNSKSSLFLLHIDGLLFVKDTKCDCAVISYNELNFIEFKSNAINKSEEAINDNYEKASSQLLSTLRDFRSRYTMLNMSLDDLVNIECFAVFNRTVPRNSATQKRVSACFLKESKGVKLKFENSKKILK